MPALAWSTQSLSQYSKFGGCPLPLLWKKIGPHGLPSVTHQWCVAYSCILPVFRGFSNCVVCQFAPPRPFSGGLGSCVLLLYSGLRGPRWLCASSAPPRPFGGIKVVMCRVVQLCYCDGGGSQRGWFFFGGGSVLGENRMFILLVSLPLASKYTLGWGPFPCRTGHRASWGALTYEA